MSSRSHQAIEIPSITKQLHWTAPTPQPHERGRKNALQDRAKAYKRIVKLTESVAVWRRPSQRYKKRYKGLTWQLYGNGIYQTKNNRFMNASSQNTKVSSYATVS